MNILQINSSLYGEDGQSSRLANEFVAALLERNPGAELVVRDLVKNPVPHLDLNTMGVHSEELIGELRRADVLVLGLPMYNFGVPSQLKAYFDHVARAGVTFRYAEQGPVGLLTGKKAYVLATRGGSYAGTPRDLETGYVRQFLGFIGITDVEFVYAEGLAINEASRQASLARAANSIARLIGVERLAG
jgi:FMN-dependent NADH-azoreductase